MTIPKGKIPNIITVSRMLLVLMDAIAIIQDRKGNVILFGLAWIYLSDMLDGYIARKLHAESILGRHLDVLADGLYTIGFTAVFTYSTSLSPAVLLSIVIEYLVFIFTAKKLASKGHGIYDAIGKSAAVYYYLFTGVLTIIWVKEMRAEILIGYLSGICIVLTVIGCACRIKLICKKT
ncbi:CDP-alcohol phosphatidyltransferase [[Clostridium] polysaccharolyticum]|uniref:CDP-alcohol phosphatidyltransferase n=2 Tax=[Clostridium] polysaccharolyticum TaxID=29364 RepID=A0A1I0EF12_9FIRM|nr:CDP-alcohol phosphatidyltransferase [[Clostridium] polysaccharolyticum]